MGPEGRPQRGLRPAGVAPDGTSAAVRRVRHPEKHGTGTQLPDQHAQVPRSGSVLPSHCAAAWPLHALLLLHSRRSPGPDAAVRGVLPAVPHHLLSQRPSLHRARTPPPRPPLSQRRQCVLATSDPAALQAAADRLSPTIIRQRLEHWTWTVGPKFSSSDRAAINLTRHYSL